MIKVLPKVYCIAGTILNADGVDEFLKDIDQDDYTSNAKTYADGLIEFAGRLCYRSWKAYDGTTGTNPNVTKVREDNTDYVQNIIGQAHGSTLEHSYITLLFHNVSRVFTHELVRHRAGMAYSQESLRYVRLDELKFWLPSAVEESDELRELYTETVEYLEKVQLKLNDIVQLDGEGFGFKKEWTSRFRRLAPLGLATTILATGNLRAWRHIVNMRSSTGAEEEIRMIMDQVVPMLKDFAPAVFYDLSKTSEGWKYESNPKP